MTQNSDTALSTEADTIETAATDLKLSFEEMGEQMDELAETMGAVADGLESIGNDGEGPEITEGPQTPSTTAFGAADD